MSKLSIALLGGQGEEKCRADGEDTIWMACQGEYGRGDKLVFTTDEYPGFYVIRVDGAMDEAYVWLTQGRVEYPIPFDPENPFQLDRISYCPGSFTGQRHYVTIRRARAGENGNWRNLAKNVMDWRGAEGCYPHARANVETRGESLFAARNVIDGVTANSCHYPWPFQSWGIDRREDAEITIEFGRPVDMDELRLVTRADFPHDSWWERATVTFSDGTSEVLSIEKSAAPHVFPIRRQGITWLTLGELIQADDPSPFPALTQIEVYGRNSGEAASAAQG